MGETVPGSEAVLKVLLQEQKPFEDLTKKFNEVSSTVTGFFGAGEAVKENTKPALPVTSTTKKADVAKATPALPALKAPAPTKAPEQPKAEIPKAKAPELPKDMAELAKLAEASANVAVKSYEKAVIILQSYTTEVKKVVEAANEKIDGSSWTILKNKTSARDAAVKAAETAAAEARQTIENIEKALYKSDVASELKEPLKAKVRNFLDSLEAAKKGVYEAYEHSDLTEKYWRSIESARNHFIKDIEDLFPNVNFSQKKLGLSKEEVDLFLVFAHSQYVAVQKELHRLQTEGEVRLRRAIDSVRGGDDSVANKAEVEFEVEKCRRELEADNLKKIFKYAQDKEKELNNMLKRQADAHIDHLKESLDLKEKEMRRKFDRELEEKLTSENANYKTQLATMIGKLKGMDDAMKGIYQKKKK